MGNRRMFSNDVVLSDAFIEMSTDAKLLYFMYGMQCDDDGFVDKPKTIMRSNGIDIKAHQELLDKRFILTFPSEVIVIKHHPLNNTIQKDRYKKTTYVKEKATLSINEYGAYTDKKACIQQKQKSEDVGSKKTKKSDLLDPQETDFLDTQEVGFLETQVKLSKDKLSKDNIYKGAQNKFVPPTLEEVQVYCQSRENGIDAESFIAFYASKNWMIGKNKMKDWKMAIITWEKRKNSDIDTEYKKARIAEINNKLKSDAQKTNELFDKAEQFKKSIGIGVKNGCRTGKELNTTNQSLLPDIKNTG